MPTTQRKKEGKMIKANELRIGNWVKTNSEWHENGISEIHYISPLNIIVRTNGVYQQYDINEIEPIPLTEEWLVKLGFVYNEYMYSYNLNIVISKNIEWIGIYSNRMDDDAEFNAPKFVNQLQNLYFALTGQELEMKGGENG